MKAHRPRRPAASQGSNRRRDRLCGFAGLVETLEQRVVLDAGGMSSPWQNPFAPADVNSDGYVSGIDLITLVSELNGSGARSLEGSPQPGFFGGSSMWSIWDSGSNAGPAYDTFIDVNGDSAFSAMDMLLVASQLNSNLSSAQARVSLRAVDLSGDPITGPIPQGTYFRLEAYVDDLRTSGDTGLSAAFVDVVYDSSVVSVAANEEFLRTIYNTQLLTGNLAVPGLINDAGGVTSTAPPNGGNEELLWSLPMLASGTVNSSTLFDPQNPSNPPFTDSFFYPATAINSSEIEYIGTAITIGDPPTTPFADLTFNNTVTVTEGDSGTVAAVFTINLSNNSQDVEVRFATQPGGPLAPASAGSDYIGTSGILVFNTGGATSQSITITVIGDGLSEPDESFQLNLLSIKNAIAPAVTVGTVSIINDDAPAVSVNDVTVTEGNSGTVDMVFTVSLNTFGNQAGTIAYSTVDGTGLTGAQVGDADYFPTSGTLTFAAGSSTPQTVTVRVRGDALGEANETFSMVLSNPTNLTLGDPIGVGTILNDDDPRYFIDDVSTTEGNSGTKNMVFSVNLTGPFAQQVLIGFATQDNTALAPSDYTARSGQLTFNPGVTQQFITVVINGDAVDESDEQFFVNLTSSSPPTVVALDPTGIGTIINDDRAVTITDAQVLEGNSGTVDLVFRVDISTSGNTTGTVQFTTVDGTATTANLDYNAISGTLTFTSFSSAPQFITVTVRGDTVGEPNENFTVVLSNPVNLTIADAQGIGTILNDDAPGITISDAAPVQEGNSGTTNAVFTVNLTGASATTVTVAYNTANVTATAGSDYLAQSGTVTFVPGETSKLVTIGVLGDLVDETDETFNVLLSFASGGTTITDGTGVGTIIDDDQPGGFRIQDAVVVEGDSGSKSAIFEVELTAALGVPVTVNYATANVTATAGSDYASQAGTLTFAPGQGTQFITIAVNGDAVAEGDETYTVTLSNSSSPSAGLIDAVATGTIINDDPAQADEVRIRLVATSDQAGLIPIVDAVDLGDTFYLQVLVTDLRSINAADKLVGAAFLDVFYESNLVTATGKTYNTPFYTEYTNRPPDITAPGALDEIGGTIDFGNYSPGGLYASEIRMTTITMVASATGIVNFTPDPADLINPFHDTLVRNPNAGPLDPTQFLVVSPANIEYVGTSVEIGSNSISISDAQISEGNSGTTNLVFTVTRFRPDSGIPTATVQFSTVAGIGTATSGVDYNPTSGTLTLGLGSAAQQTVTVQVIGDLTFENNENFLISLSNAVGATISDGTAVGTILNDDLVPTAASVSSESGNEGSVLTFTVTLNGTSAFDTLIPFNTANGTATAGSDYTARSGILTFTAGTTTQTVSVTTLNDLAVESNETFTLAAGSQTGTGTIFDVEPIGASGIVYVDLNNNGVRDGNEIVLPNVYITITGTGTTTFGPQTVLTDSNGAYSFLGLAPGTYSIVETQPGFFFDGRDTIGIPPVDSPTNDRFDITVTATSGSLSNYNFAESGLRPQFAIAFFNRRALFSSAIITGDTGGSGVPSNGVAGTIADINLQQGVSWISFDGGWQGTRLIEADFLTALGDVNLTLYDRDLNVLVTSLTEADHAQILYNGTPGQTYLLKISGTNSNVDVTISETVSVSNVSVLEGNSGVVAAVFAATISSDWYKTGVTQAVTVDWTSTTGGTATDGVDLTPSNGSLSFAPGESVKFITVNVNGDSTYENSETFFVQLQNAAGLPIGKDLGQGTIVDDDTPPALSIDDIFVAEGDFGTSNAVFTVSLSNASGADVVVRYSTANGTAGSSDYAATSGTITIAAGNMQQQVTVGIKGDTSNEGNETFFINLSNPTGATILDGQGQATIVDELSELASASFFAGPGDSSSSNSAPASNSLAATPPPATLASDEEAFVNQAVWSESPSSDPTADSVDSAFADEDEWILETMLA